jgi:hypothetical protein
MTQNCDPYWKQEIIFNDYGELLAEDLMFIAFRCLRKTLAINNITKLTELEIDFN